MPLKLAYIKKLAKDLIIEGISISIAYGVDKLIDYGDENDDMTVIFRNAVASRVYYFSKNILYAINVKLNGKHNNKHIYAGVYNAGIIASLYPSARYFPMNISQYNVAMVSSLSFIGASLIRTFVEKPLEKQTIKKHIDLHKGCLLFGVGGSLFSLIPNNQVTSPSFYWAGDIIDIHIQQKESYKEILLSARSTPQLQGFIACFIKVFIQLANESMPFPNYFLDFFIGSAHRILVQIRAGLKSNISTQPIVVNEPESLKTPSPKQLSWLMSRTQTTTFQANSVDESKIIKLDVDIPVIASAAKQ